MIASNYPIWGRAVDTLASMCLSAKMGRGCTNVAFIDSLRMYADEMEKLLSPDERGKAQVDTTLLSDVASERRRQTEVEGYTTDRDDSYTHGELCSAAEAYFAAYWAATTCGETAEMAKDLTAHKWPWHESTFKVSGTRRDLIKGMALLVAEDDRQARKAARASA